MKIVVDARMQRHGGIGTYITHVLHYLKKSAHEFHILDLKNLSSPIYSLKEQIELPRKIPPCDLFWSPHFNIPLWPLRAKKHIVTIHDLYHLDLGSLEKKLYARLLLSRAISKADQLITISEFSKSRLLHYFPEAKKKTTVIPLGCDHLYEEREVLGLPENFFLFVGNPKPHKNLAFILEAQLKQPTFHLVIVGKITDLTHEIEKKYPSLKGRLHFLGHISDQQLTWLYAHAEALIFPSLYEGWGLPPLEAMRLGCPVLASNASSIPEACRKGALFFDPQKPEELLIQMDHVKEQRKKLIIEGKKWSSGFLWEKTAEAHLDLFEKIPNKCVSS